MQLSYNTRDITPLSSGLFYLPGSMYKKYRFLHHYREKTLLWAERHPLRFFSPPLFQVLRTFLHYMMPRDMQPRCLRFDTKGCRH